MDAPTRAFMNGVLHAYQTFLRGTGQKLPQLSSEELLILEMAMADCLAIACGGEPEEICTSDISSDQWLRYLQFKVNAGLRI